MILTGPAIAAAVAAGRIVIDPYDPARLQPASYDLTLGDLLVVYACGYDRHQACDNAWPFAPDLDGRWEELDTAREPVTRNLVIPPGGIRLYPGVTYLGHTVERTESPHHRPTIDGRSSVGRVGVFTHVTAGYGDPGFRGHWTLEIVAVQPTVVYAGTRVCQISFAEVTGALTPYAGQYREFNGPRASGLWREVAARHRAQP